MNLDDEIGQLKIADSSVASEDRRYGSGAACALAYSMGGKNLIADIACLGFVAFEAYEAVQTIEDMKALQQAAKGNCATCLLGCHANIMTEKLHNNSGMICFRKKEMKVIMKTGTRLRVLDYVLAIAVMTAIVALVLIFFAYLPSIAEMPVRSVDRAVLYSAKQMAVKASCAAGLAAGMLVASLVALKLRFKSRNELVESGRPNVSVAQGNAGVKVQE